LADVATRFRKLLLADTDITAAVGQRIHQATVPEDTTPPFIFFKRTSVRFERCLGETGAAPLSHSFDVDCVALNLDDAQALADQIRSYDGYIGTFGDSTCKGIFVDEQSDEYESEFGDHVASLSVEVMPT
jgi:hypothetical protein